MMKILIISNSISGGGAEKSMRMINRELNSRGIDSTLVCLNNSGKDLALDKEVILGRKWKSGLTGTFINFWNFLRICKEINPSTVVANCELPELYLALSPFKFRNLICVEHTSLPWAGRRTLGTFVRILLKLKRASWVSVNRNQSGVWPTGSSASFIPNPVTVPNLDGSDKQNRFVFIGRLRPEKGIQGILEAVSRAGARIDVFGSGNMEVELKKNFTRTADFHGFIDNPWERINRNQTLIVASEYEGDGIVIVEAIISAMPLLLLDNKDLRRFQLPEVNYFKDFEVLRRKTRLASEDPETFRVTQEKSNEYANERNLPSIVSLWITLLR